MPSVSVVIPVKDDAPALRTCLELLAAQTVPPFEVVVVDNGSTDDSAAVAREHGARVVPEPRPGIPAAAAAGYDAATGDVVLRCDADTRPGPDCVARLLAALAEPGTDAVTARGDFYDVGTLRALVHGRLYLWAYYRTMHAAMAHPPLWGSATAFRRDLWLDVRDRVDRTDPELHDDVDLSLALDPAARVRVVDVRVGVSGRSLRGAAQTRRRFRRALRTLRRGWADLSPADRWSLRLVGRRIHRRAEVGGRA